MCLLQDNPNIPKRRNIYQKGKNKRECVNADKDSGIIVGYENE